MAPVDRPAMKPMNRRPPCCFCSVSNHLATSLRRNSTEKAELAQHNSVIALITRGRGRAAMQDIPEAVAIGAQECVAGSSILGLNPVNTVTSQCRHCVSELRSIPGPGTGTCEMQSVAAARCHLYSTMAIPRRIQTGCTQDVLRTTLAALADRQCAISRGQAGPD